VAVGAVMALAAGLLWGLINGLLVTRAHIPALVATLATLSMAMGMAMVVTNGNDIAGTPAQLVNSLGLGRLFGVVPWLFVIALLVAAGGGALLHYTQFGHHTLAIGTNPEASRRAGIAVNRHLVTVYVISGTLAGLAGFLNLARYATTTLAGHNTDNILSIAVVVLGGTSLFGGAASMVGTVIGVLIPVVLKNGLTILNVQPFWEQVAIGVMLAAAVYIDQFRRGRMNSPQRSRSAFFWERL